MDQYMKLLKPVERLNGKIEVHDIIVLAKLSIKPKDYINRKRTEAKDHTLPPTARVLASQAEAIVRTGKHGHNIE